MPAKEELSRRPKTASVSEQGNREPRQRTYYAGGDWAHEKSCRRPPTSLIQILAVPDYFHQKQVCVEGCLIVEFEGTAIYLSSEDANYRMHGNSLWVNFDQNTTALPSSWREIAKQYNGKHVWIKGTFNRDNWGHFNGWPGAIERVSEIKVLRDHSHDPTPVQRYCLSAKRALEKERKPDNAIWYSSCAIKLEPQCAEAYYLRARAYQKKGDIAKAEADIAEAKKLGYTPAKSEQ
ncbi:MAG: hypothetical protein ABFC63_09250 [Thermoguttaceae bacterium]